MCPTWASAGPRSRSTTRGFSASARRLSRLLVGDTRGGLARGRPFYLPPCSQGQGKGEGRRDRREPLEALAARPRFVRGGTNGSKENSDTGWGGRLVRAVGGGGRRA